MKCPITEKQIYLYCDNLICEKDRAVVKEHIDSCARCGKIYNAARKGLSAFVGDAFLEPMLSERVAHEIINTSLRESKKPVKTRILQFPKMAYGIAAAAALAAALGISTPLIMHAFHPAHAVSRAAIPVKGSAAAIADSLSGEDVPAPVSRSSKQSGVKNREADYGAIRVLIRRGKYDSAIIAIPSFIAGHPNWDDADMAFSDLALCYCRLGAWDNALAAFAKVSALTKDSLVREGALHRTNSILFTELSRIDEADAGVAKYLATYPRGTWRELEYILFIRIKIAKHDRAEAVTLLKRFKMEFPSSRIAVNLHNEIKQMNKVATINK